MSEIEKLKNIVHKLRAPGGCPWDQKQTMESITPHIIEEAYELIDSIQENNMTDIKEELGDVLLHVVMLAEMASETNDFTFNDIAKQASDKMIRRHPHVFGNATADTVDEVHHNWEEIKKEEKKEQRRFDSIPKSLPALLQAQKLQKKAAKVGFDWPDVEGTLNKLEEEIVELKDELQKAQQDKSAIYEEFGDMLFSLVNVGRKLNIQNEECLRDANMKFWKRFYVMEDLIVKDKLNIENCNLSELDNYWNQTKNLLKNSRQS